MTDQMNVNGRIIRSYEVSVWTLQDSFITVLKWSNMENKGAIQNPKMTLNTDGTLNFSFSIPMSLYIKGIWLENPLWYSTLDGTLVTNMRKIKVIFNKKEEDEEVFEFLITNMQLTHSSDQPICEITCDGGLAYHELGKQGYKVSLSSEAFYEEDAALFAESTNDAGETDDRVIDDAHRLHATLDYWCEKMDLAYAAEDSDIEDPRKWYYRVLMDWSSYANNMGRRLSNKIYEDEYIASWDNEGLPIRVETYKEKERLMDAEGSNFYNLTLDLALTFGVFCRYKYLYDDNYHIVGKLIIFYNNFFNEKEGIIQLTYPYTTTEVSRNIDSTDIVTKMYVDNIEDDSALGILSIMNTEANKMQEDYVLNFDYLYEVKTITDEQYEAVKLYEEDIRQINSIIIPILEELSTLYLDRTDVSAKLAVSKNGIALAQERLDDNQALIDSLSETDGVRDLWIEYNSSAPDHAVVLKEGDIYKINIKTKGVDENSIRIYSSYPIVDGATPLQAQIDTDSLGNVTGASCLNVSDSVKMVYLTYKYNPGKYYEDFRKTWTLRLNKDEQDFADYTALLEEIETSIETLTVELTNSLSEKETLIKDFALMMGPALREGHWTPDNYNDYGDRYVKVLGLPAYEYNVFPLEGEMSNYILPIWDDKLFTEEQHNYYNEGVNEEVVYYPCIDLTNDLWASVFNYLYEEKPVSILYYDYAVIQASESGSSEQFDTYEMADDANWHILTIGSSAQIIFVSDGRTGLDRIKPVIVVTDAENMSDDEIKYMKLSAFLANVTTEEVNDTIATNITTITTLTSDNWIDNSYLNYAVNEDNDDTNNNPSAAVKLVEARLYINTLGLMNNTSDLNLKFGDVNLKDYNDYSIIIRDGGYYITLKPMTILLTGYKVFLDSHVSDDSNENNANIYNSLIQDIIYLPIEIRYGISNASTSIYLDALLVHKENAYPQVSYTVLPSVINKLMMRRMYLYLNRIININDNELKLHDAYGYISELSLDLDHPWQDSITVLNYKNKFEDIFSTITAQTEAMLRREYTLNETMSLVTPGGLINKSTLQSTLDSNEFNYRFNSGQLTITEIDGILGVSDNGAVNFRNNGIFTSTKKDNNGDWIWTSAILPEGINANLIKAGQLDTDKIMIYSGNDIRFQWNSEGLYAYRSILETGTPTITDTNDVNSKQFVVFNSDGLSLVRREWNFDKIGGTTYYYDSNGNELDSNSQELTAYSVKYWINENEKFLIPHEGIKLVEVSWDGFKMRNYKNEEIFYANSETGDLTITGNFSAYGGNIGGWHVATGKLEAYDEDNPNKYIALSTDNYSIWAGNLSPTLAPFSVTQAGVLKAESGSIGGWSISLNALSGGSLRLISKTDENTDFTGLLFVRENLDSGVMANRTVNNVVYYKYEYSVDNGTTYTECYHEKISTLETVLNMTLSAADFNSYTVTIDSQPIVLRFYHDVAVPISVQPKYKIYKTVNITDPTTGTVTPQTTTYVGWVPEDYDNANGTYEAATAENDTRIVKYIPDPVNAPSVTALLEYDPDIEHAHEINNNIWFTKLLSAYQATATNPITFSDFAGLESITIQASNSSATPEDYVIYNTVSEWQPITVNSSVILRTTKYVSTFSIGAELGDLLATYGLIGNFNISNAGLSDGHLYNTYIAPSNYITLTLANGKLKTFTIEEIGLCFYDLSLNSKKGIVTFTRLNGDKVNFKTAALKASLAASAASGKITSLDIHILPNHYGEVECIIKTGMGSTASPALYLNEILTSGSYGNNNFKLVYNDKYMQLAADPHYVYLLSRKNDGQYDTLKISDGGAYLAGYDLAVADDAGHNTATTLSATYNATTNKISYEVKTWGNHTKTGTIDTILSGRTITLVEDDNTIKVLANFLILDTSVHFNRAISLAYGNTPGKVNCTVTNSGSTSTKILNDGGCYAAGWGDAYNKVWVYSSALGANNTRKTLTLKTPSSIQGNLNTYKYIIADADDNTIIVTLRLNDTTSSDLIVGRYAHGKYDAGWAAARSNVHPPAEGSLTSNIDHKFTFTAPYSTVGLPVEYYYKIENNNNNSIKVTLSNNKNTTTRNIGTFTHNKYKEGWNSCIDTLTDANENYQKTEVINYNDEDIIVLDITNNTQITDNNHIYILLDKHLYTLPDKKTIS